MSISAYSLSDAAIAAQAALSAQASAPTSPGKKPPPTRTIIAVSDTTQSPEPR